MGGNASKSRKASRSREPEGTQERLLEEEDLEASSAKDIKNNRNDGDSDKKERATFGRLVSLSKTSISLASNVVAHIKFPLLSPSFFSRI